MLTFSRGGALYSEVQCIMGNGHMVPPPTPDRMTDRQDWKHYLPQLRCRAVIITIPKLTDSWFMVLSSHAAGFFVTQSLGTVLTFLGSSIQTLKAVTSQVYPAIDKKRNCILITSKLCAWNSVNITFNTQTNFGLQRNYTSDDGGSTGYVKVDRGAHLCGSYFAWGSQIYSVFPAVSAELSTLECGI